MRVGWLSMMVFLGGCVYAPPLWDAGDEIYHLDFIEPGVTTKDQVLAELGEPDRSYQMDEGASYWYMGDKSEGAMAMIIPPMGLLFGLLEESPWTVNIKFDLNDVVSEFWTSEDLDLERQYAAETRQVGRNRMHRDISLRQQWHSRCKRAVKGDGQASAAIASHFRHGWEPIEQDRVKAYLWYTVASDQGNSSATDYRKDLESKMSSAEISAAKRLVQEPQRLDAEQASSCGMFAYPVSWQSLCLAAQNGDPEAQHEIGRMYEDGVKPVGQDLALAYAWYLLSLKSGYEERSGSNWRQTDTGWECCFPDRTRAEIIAEELSEAEVAKAQSFVANWQANPAECEAIEAQANM